MSGNTFGTRFRVTTFGESHGVGVGCIVDGCPAGVALTPEMVQIALNRRRPGQSELTTPRDEKDMVEILSGTFEGKTIGSPIAMMLRNKTHRSGDYKTHGHAFRPSHSDFTYFHKYGINPLPGGGRSSARETAARVMAGAVSEAYMMNIFNIQCVAGVHSVAGITANSEHIKKMTRELVDASPTRCPDPVAAELMSTAILEAKHAGDSVGGVIECRIKNVPIGLGEPVFDRLEADLAKAMLSIPATKGVEFGSGFAAASMRGSQHNDPYTIDENGGISIQQNFAGGVLGGISSGADVVLRIAFKPTSTILTSQKTVTLDGHETVLDNVKGRHDPCVLPRAVPIVEAMVMMTVMDHLLRRYGDGHVRQG